MKRMFTDDVLFSDCVTGLSHEAFELYIMLMLLADDDGFVNKLRVAINTANVDRNTINELVASSLVFEVSDGVYVITDWLKHNNIDTRAYKKPAPPELREIVKVKPGGRYTTDKSGMSIDEYRANRIRRDKTNAVKKEVQMNSMLDDGITPDPNKILCGCHSNIEYTEGELQALHEQLGEQANDYINQLSSYVAETGDYPANPYKSTLVLADLPDGNQYTAVDISQRLHGSFESAIENAY